MVDMRAPRVVVRTPAPTVTRGPALPTTPRAVVVPVAGPPGRDGTGSPAFEWQQTTPSTVWDIPHNLGFKPAGISVRALDGTNYRPDVAYPDENTIRLNLPDSILGTAYLS